MILRDNEDELMALYAVIKRELEAIETLRRHADASISRLESLRNEIKSEVTQESILGIRNVLSAVKTGFKETIEQQSVATVQKLEGITGHLTHSAQAAGAELKTVKTLFIISLISIGIVIGIVFTVLYLYFGIGIKDLTKEMAILTQEVQSCKIQIPLKKHKK